MPSSRSKPSKADLYYDFNWPSRFIPVAKGLPVGMRVTVGDGEGCCKATVLEGGYVKLDIKTYREGSESVL